MIYTEDLESWTNPCNNQLSLQQSSKLYRGFKYSCAAGFNGNLRSATAFSFISCCTADVRRLQGEIWVYLWFDCLFPPLAAKNSLTHAPTPALVLDQLGVCSREPKCAQLGLHRPLQLSCCCAEQLRQLRALEPALLTYSTLLVRPRGDHSQKLYALGQYIAQILKALFPYNNPRPQNRRSTKQREQLFYYEDKVTTSEQRSIPPNGFLVGIC